MSYRVSKLNLYDELTETVKHTISANERALNLPLSCRVNDRDIDSLLLKVDALQLSLESLTGETAYTQEMKISLSSQQAQEIKADGASPVANPNSSDGGWYFKNDGTPNKINWYFVAQDDNNHKTYGGVKTLYAVVKIYNNVDQQSVPWIGIYTKPTGSGDSGSWYKSRRNWVIPSAVTPTISNGDTVLLYMGDDPATVEPSIPHIALEIDSGSSNGDDAPEQELLLVALSTDSSAPVNNVEFTCKNFASNLEGESIDRVLD